jgi:hypothetical protein
MRSGIILLLLFHFQAFYSSYLSGYNDKNNHKSLRSKDYSGLSALGLDFTPRIAGNVSQVQIIFTVSKCSTCSDIKPGDTITVHLPGFSRGSDASVDTSQNYLSDLSTQQNAPLFSRFNVSSWSEATSQLILTCTGAVPQGSKTFISVPSAAGVMLPKLGLLQNQVRVA